MGRPRVHQLREYEPFEWTWRVRGGQHLLSPDEEATDLMRGVFGRALWLMGDAFHLYYVAVESTHLHVYGAARTPQDAVRAKTHLATNLSKEISALRGIGPGGIWARAGRTIPILSGLEGRLKYGLAHGLKSGLAPSVEAWPGLGLLPTLIHGEIVEGTWYDRDAYQRAHRTWARRRAAEQMNGADQSLEAEPTLGDYATRYPVTLTPPPGWADLSLSDRCDRWRSLIDQANDAYADRAGARVVRGDPLRYPAKRPKRSPAPWVHGTRAERRAWLRRYRAHVETMRACMARLARGELDVQFPWEGWVPWELAPLRAPAPSG